MYSSTQIDASNFVHGVDRAFIIILGFSFAFLIVLTFLMILFIIKYRRSKHPVAVQMEGNARLEIAWTLGALILVLVLFYFGWAGWKPMTQPPDDAMKIKAVARMWKFQFVYGNGRVTDTLYVPVNQPVVLDLVALDVIHSLYIPAFRLKQDMVPGLKKNMWFQAGRTGKYDLFCAEYCGLQHSYMNTGVNVLSQDDFKSWYPRVGSGTGSTSQERLQRMPFLRWFQTGGPLLPEPFRKTRNGHYRRFGKAGHRRFGLHTEIHIYPGCRRGERV
jgi:cytochrome c oxidase subunit 2